MLTETIVLLDRIRVVVVNDSCEGSFKSLSSCLTDWRSFFFDGPPLTVTTRLSCLSASFRSGSSYYLHPWYIRRLGDRHCGFWSADRPMSGSTVISVLLCCWLVKFICFFPFPVSFLYPFISCILFPVVAADIYLLCCLCSFSYKKTWFMNAQNIRSERKKKSES